MSDFIHLHCHTQYSFLRGANTLDEMLETAKAMGLDTLAMTDTNGLYGVIPFVKKAVEFGLKPLIGAEIVSPDGSERAVLLARNFTGYGGICKVITERQLGDRLPGRHREYDNSQESPAGSNNGSKRLIDPSRASRAMAKKGTLDFDLSDAILRHADNCTILSPSPSLLQKLRGAGIKRGLYIELHNFGDSESRQAIRQKLQLARALELPTIATNAVHFKQPADFKLHRILSAIRENVTTKTLTPGSIAHPEAWLKPPQAMAALFRELPEAIANTVRVAEECNVDLRLGEMKFPTYTPPDGRSAMEYLTMLCNKGLRKRYRSPATEPARRMRQELEVIEKMNFAQYFLIVWDIVYYARTHGIPHVGRGSAANSIVAFCLGITDVDPLLHNLYFERFMNPERKDCPDIDIDFPWDRRDEVVEYVFQKYGQDHAAMIATHITFRGRSSVREVGKAVGLPIPEIDAFCRRIPHFHDIGDLEKAIDKIPEARHLPIKEEPYRSILKICRRISGFPRHLSIHCAGLVISPGPITDYIPLERASKGVVITQFDMYPVEDMGLVKMDILSQRALAVSVKVRKVLRERRKIELEFAQIDRQFPKKRQSKNPEVPAVVTSNMVEPGWRHHLVFPRYDPKTLKILREGQTMGCFYIESPGMRLLNKKLGVQDFELLVAASSVIRPGVADSGMMKAFVDRHTGKEQPVYLHPKLKDLLGDTYGVMVYQEDVLKVAHHLAGMSFGEADSLRRCMSKKRNWEAMSNYKERFVDGCRQNGLKDDVIEALWKQIESFAGYAFCKAHSASFAILSYETAFLKAHFPAEFMAAVISNQGGYYGTSAYVEEARRMGLRILPPHINESEIEYTGEGDWVRTGLMQIKRLSLKTMESIVAEREQNGAFLNLADFLERTSVEKTETESLILCGALDGLKAETKGEARPAPTRPELLWELGATYYLVGKRKREAESLVKVSDPPPFIPTLPEYTLEEKLQLEMEHLGLCISRHPLYLFQDICRSRSLIPARDIPQCAGQIVEVIGWIVTVKRTMTVKFDYMKFLTMEDETAIFEVTLFPRAYQEYGHLVNDRGPYLVRGKVEEDSGSYTITCDSLKQMRRKDEETARLADFRKYAKAWGEHLSLSCETNEWE